MKGKKIQHGTNTRSKDDKENKSVQGKNLKCDLMG